MHTQPGSATTARTPSTRNTAARPRAGSNTITDSGKSFQAELRSTANPTSVITAAANLNGGVYTTSLVATFSGPATLSILYVGSYLPGYPAELYVLPGPLDTAASVLRPLPTQVTAGGTIGVTLEGRDSYNNLVRTVCVLQSDI